MSSDDSQMMDHTIHKPYNRNLNRMLDLYSTSASTILHLNSSEEH